MPKFPYITEADKNRLFKYLPCEKATLISKLKAEGWREHWIRHLIWYLRCRTYELYTYQGILKKV